jgi:hypothetical protein
MERKNVKRKGSKFPPEVQKEKIPTEVSDLEIAKKMLKIHQSAVDRKLEFNLTLETVKKLLSYSACYYTNRKFEEEGNYARSFDRIDSAKGYIEGNVVACTVDINGKKSNLSIDEIECLYKKLVSGRNKAENQVPRGKTTKIVDIGATGPQDESGEDI